MKNRKTLPLLFTLSIGINLFISMGPLFQHYGWSIITNNLDSIYDSATQDCACQPITWEAWRDSITFWPILLASFLLSFTALKNRNPRNSAAYLTILSFASLTTIDIFITFLYEEIESNTLPVSLISNLLGSIAISAFTLLTVYSVGVLNAHLKTPEPIKIIITTMSPLALGIAASIIGFIALSYILNLTPKDIFIKFTSETLTEFDSPRGDNIFPPRSVEDASITGTSISTKETLRIKPNSDAFETNLGLAIFKDCTPDQALEKIEKNRIIFKPLSGLAKLTLTSSILNFSIKTQSSKTEVNRNQDITKRLFGLSDHTEERYKIFTPITKSDSLIIKDPLNSATFVFHGITKNLLDKNSDLNFHLNAHNEQYKITFPTKDIVVQERPKPCSIEYGLDWNENTETIRDSFLYAGILLFIQGEIKDFHEAMKNPNLYSLGGLSGQVSLSLKRRPQSLVNQTITAEYLNISGQAEQLSINSVLHETGNTDHYYVYGGEIKADVTRDGEMLVSANGSFLLKDGTRYNKTRWESTDWPGRTILLSMLGALLLYMRKKISDILSLNADLDAPILK